MVSTHCQVNTAMLTHLHIAASPLDGRFQLLLPAESPAVPSRRPLPNPDSLDRVRAATASFDAERRSREGSPAGRAVHPSRSSSSASSASVNESATTRTRPLFYSYTRNLAGILGQIASPPLLAPAGKVRTLGPIFDDYVDSHGFTANAILQIINAYKDADDQQGAFTASLSPRGVSLTEAGWMWRAIRFGLWMAEQEIEYSV